jgi:hypothetical protein
MAMEELKSCLFCGRYIDKTFAYCPYCGFEFSGRDDGPEYSEEAPALSSVVSLVSEEGGNAPSAVQPSDYLARLRDMQKTLADMERELDLILSGSGAAPGLDRREAKLPDTGRGSVGLSGHGQVTSSSKGP